MKTIKKIKFAFIAVGVCVVLYFAFTMYSRVADRYLWLYSPSDYFEKGTAMLSLDSDGKKIKKGLDFIQNAAEQGHDPAQIFLGELYIGDIPDEYHMYNKEKIAEIRSVIAPDKQKGISYFNDFIDNPYSNLSNDSKMQYNIGLLFKAGILKSRNKKQDADAKEWFTKAAADGNSVAMYEMGMHFNSIGNYIKAHQWFTKAFDWGKDPCSAIMIGDYCFYGKNKPKDYNQSIKWYQQALNVLASPVPFLSEKNRIKLTDNATQRLDIAIRKTNESKELITLKYIVVGGVTDYSIFIPELNNNAIGEVKNQSGEIVARIKTSLLSDVGYTACKVSSMNEGLYWALNTYAEDVHGKDKKFNWVITKN